MGRILHGAAVLLLCTAAHAAEVDLPYIGEPADRTLSPLEEARIGRTVHAQLLAHGLILEDPELDTYINRLGNEIARHGSAPDQPLRFFFVNDSAINAFALPGGYVGINAGLISAAESESELAGVVAHEIAHVTQRHIARTIAANQGWQMAGIGLMLAALIAGGGNPELAQAALGIGLSAAAQRQINFTRAHEIEADRVGIRALGTAGFDATGMARFFQRLEQSARLYGEGVPEILRTHPVNATRITEAQARAADYGPPKRPDSAQFAVMRARARVLSARLNADALEHFRAMDNAHKAPTDRYGLALALGLAGQYRMAEDLFAKLAADDPGNLHYQLARARNQLLLGEPDAAITALHRTQRAHPKEPAAVLALADALLRNGQSSAARQLLLESDLLYQENSESFRLLAMAAREMHQPAEAHFQMAAYRRIRGDFRGSLQQLRSALLLPGLSDHDRQRISARYAEYKDAFPKEAQEPEPQPQRRR